MASACTRHHPELGVPALVELPGSTTVDYPHLVMRISNIDQRVPIEVRHGAPAVNVSDEIPRFVQHPTPFDVDGTVSPACKELLITALQEDVGRARVKIQQCLVWSASSCCYVEVDGSICETTEGAAMAVGAAFESARLAVIRGKYPQIHVDEPCGITRASCPSHATKEDLVAQAVGIVLNKGYRVRVSWSESETIYAELTDEFGAKSEQIQPCVAWSECRYLEGNSGTGICDTKLSLGSPHIVIYGRNTFALFYPDTLTKDELATKGAELMHLFPRVCVVFSSTESIWPKPPQLDVAW